MNTVSNNENIDKTDKIKLTDEKNPTTIDNEPKKISSTQERIDQRNKKVSRISLKNQNIFARPESDSEYYYRYINDIDARIENYELAGYEKVENTKVNREKCNIRSGIPSNMGKYICQSVGHGITAYLMRQRREYYDADQCAKQRELDIKMKTIDRQAMKNAQIYTKDEHHIE